MNDLSGYIRGSKSKSNIRVLLYKSLKVEKCCCVYVSCSRSERPRRSHATCWTRRWKDARVPGLDFLKVRFLRFFSSRRERITRCSGKWEKSHCSSMSTVENIPKSNQNLRNIFYLLLLNWRKHLCEAFKGYKSTFSASGLHTTHT